MELKILTLLGIFMLLCVVQQSTALKCYTCSSLTNTECADLNDKGLQAQDCLVENVLAQSKNFLSQFGVSGNNAINTIDANRDNLTPTCLKVVAKYGTASVVERQCAVKKRNEDPCTATTGGNSLVELCKACEQDGCNSGNSMQLSLIVFGAMVCTARFFV